MSVTGITFGEGITLGKGINIGSGSSGFTLSSSDFTGASGGYHTSAVSNLGFTTDPGAQGPGESCWNIYLSTNNGGNLAKLNEIRAYFANNGLNSSGTSYMFNVTWGPGSTLSTGVVIVDLYDGGDTNAGMNIGVVDTSNPIWQTSNSNYYNANQGPNYIHTLVGTWLLPATFSVIKPLITNNNNWC